MSPLLFRFVHVVGVLLWIGGTVSAAVFLASYLVNRKEGDATGAAEAARAVMKKLATPGMIVAWLAGLAMLVPDFTEVYAKAGWMHGKLTLALVASGLTGFISGKLRRAASGEAVATPKALNGAAWGMVALAVVAVFLVMYQPGSR